MFVAQKNYFHFHFIYEMFNFQTNESFSLVLLVVFPLKTKDLTMNVLEIL